VRNIIIFEPGYYALSELRNGDLPTQGRLPMNRDCPWLSYFRAFGAPRYANQTFEVKASLHSGRCPLIDLG